MQTVPQTATPKQPAAPSSNGTHKPVSRLLETLRRAALPSNGKHRTKLREVRPANPCPVCGGDHKCTIGDDGAIFCGRRSGPVSGFRHLGPCRGDDQWHIYRAADGKDAPAGGDGGTKAAAIDWPKLVETLAADFTPKLRNDLAEVLGLPTDVFDLLRMGYLEKEKAWTFPEYDHRGQAIGLMRRYRNGSKKLMPGGSRGLTIVDGWKDRPGAVYLYEGASDTLTAAALGHSAVGRPSCTAGAKHLTRLLWQLSKEDQIVVVGENDQKADGTWPGKDGAVRTAEELAHRMNRPVSWTLVPAGTKDVREWVRAKRLDPADKAAWISAGKELVRLLAEGIKVVNPLPEQMSASELMAAELPEPECIVNGILTEGLNVLVSRPKMGKSWLAMGVGIDIALGRATLGDRPVVQGDVLYLALEDNRKRLKSRLQKLLGEAKAPPRLTLATKWPRTDEGGLEKIVEWVKSASEPVVVIDTWAKLRKRSARHGNAYLEDYSDVGDIKELADTHGFVVLLIHHTRKMKGEDILDEVSGTTGVAGAADTILILHRRRGQHDAALHVTGRDIDEQELAITWDRETCRWSVLGEAEECHPSESARAIKVLTEKARPMKPTELAPLLEKNLGATKMLLWRASQNGLIKSDGKGSYLV
jgi:hypothetical protein